jgi:hypothetical protein
MVYQWHVTAADVTAADVTAADVTAADDRLNLI